MSSNIRVEQNVKKRKKRNSLNDQVAAGLLMITSLANVESCGPCPALWTDAVGSHPSQPENKINYLNSLQISSQGC